MQDLDDKVVLVTGDGRGIGRAIALAFASKQSRVAIVGRTPATLDDVAEEIRRLGAEALPRVCDVTQKPAVEKLKQEIAGRFGAVQVLSTTPAWLPPQVFLKCQIVCGKRSC